MKMKECRTTPELIVKSLGFSEKFTILSKGIANRFNIVQPLRNIGFTAVLAAITLLNSSSTYITNPEFKVDVVVIDAGHGGKDSGTRGRKILEKDVALKIALKVGNYIEKYVPGVKVIYTRKTDVYLSLDERANIANRAGADLFICIHANSMPGGRAIGTETYVMGLHKDESNFEVAKRENSVILMDENYKERYQGFDPDSPESYILFSLTQSAYQQSSLLFAQKVEDQFEHRVGRNSRGVKQAGFVVLWRTTMPSVLIETGFLSHPSEEQFLAEERGQDLIASGIYRAFKEYKSEVESIN
jgi:N-acetylmuramoyl-L-alanine amidase